MDTKTGGLINFKEIHKYLLQGVYPSSFSKSDKQALRKRAKFFGVAELYYTGRGENQNDVLQLQVCHIPVSLSSCIQRA